jgi:hypothetical protein
VAGSSSMVRATAAPLALAIALLSPAGAAAAPGTVGVLLDVGVPSGLQGALALRATPRLRLEAGGGYNGVNAGIRGGASLSLLPAWITPVVAVEAGRFFRGDANPMARWLTGDEGLDEPLLRDVGYDFANLHLGVELGYARVTFYAHAGLGTMRFAVRNLEESVAALAPEPDGYTLEVRRDPVARALGPTGKMGMVIYF